MSSEDRGKRSGSNESASPDALNSLMALVKRKTAAVLARPAQISALSFHGAHRFAGVRNKSSGGRCRAFAASVCEDTYCVTFGVEVWVATACITGTFLCQLFIPNRLGDERRAAGMGGVYVEAGPFIEPECSAMAPAQIRAKGSRRLLDGQRAIRNHASSRKTARQLRPHTPYIC